MKLIVGLGNPGNKYDKTRHNIGFDILDKYINNKGLGNYKEKFQGLLIEGVYKNEKCYLLKPQTFMNLSGDSVGAVSKFYKVSPEDIVVVYDDMDLPLGSMRYREKGSSGGHNGIKSIIAHIGENFKRVRCGIGKPDIKNQNIDFVLGKFTKEEQEKIDKMMENVMVCLDEIIEGKKSEDLMQKFNKK